MSLSNHNGTALNSAAIEASSNGDNTIVAALAGKSIRVHALLLNGANAVNAKLTDGPAGTDLTGLFYLASAGGGAVLPYSEAGWFVTSAGNALVMNLSAGVAIGGVLVYSLV